MKRRLGLGFLVIITIGFFIPQKLMMPVDRATRKDYHQKSFWHHPWGRSVTHKGVDIFATKGTDLYASVSGLVLSSGTLERGGNFVLLLGPKWRLHYFAHLDSITASFGWIWRGEKIGTVGDSGNARGKPAHVHYSIVTPIPYAWKIDSSPQGWKKMFYLNPIPYLNAVE